MLGVGGYEDVISGVDNLIEKGIIDSERVGGNGLESRGIYLSLLCNL